MQLKSATSSVIRDPLSAFQDDKKITKANLRKDTDSDSKSNFNDFGDKCCHNSNKPNNFDLPNGTHRSISEEELSRVESRVLHSPRFLQNVFRSIPTSPKTFQENKTTVTTDRSLGEYSELFNDEVHSNVTKSDTSSVRNLMKGSNEDKSSISWRTNLIGHARTLHKYAQNAASVASRFMNDSDQITKIFEITDDASITSSPSPSLVLASNGDSSKACHWPDYIVFDSSPPKTASPNDAVNNSNSDRGSEFFRTADENCVQKNGVLYCKTTESLVTSDFMNGLNLEQFRTNLMDATNSLISGELMSLILCNCKITNPIIGVIQGFAIFTNYRLMLKVYSEDQKSVSWMHELDALNVPLGCIESYETSWKSKGGHDHFSINFVTKDNRGFKVTTHQIVSSRPLTNILHSLINPQRISELFAVNPQIKQDAHNEHAGQKSPSSNARRYDLDENQIDFGWRIYETLSEYRRLGIGNDGNQNELSTDTFGFRVSNVNEDYKLCPTYPRHIVVPIHINDHVLNCSAEFRAKSRLPIFSWCNFELSCSLWRCGQPKSALFNRCKEDEAFFHEIGRLSKGSRDQSPPTLIFDLRPKINALANKATGAGYEDVSNYSSCILEFANIVNIHHVRDSWSKMAQAINEPVLVMSNSSVGYHKFYTGVASSGWYDHIRSILRATNIVVDWLKRGRSVVLHCSDGWDRTPQVASLSMLAMDSYYRTAVGFVVLIEKEFLHSGHAFHSRCGAPGRIIVNAVAGNSSNSSNSNAQQSPIFVQWLECVYQYLVQFPSAFEFSQSMLLMLAAHVYSCQYGTFLCNSQREREMINVRCRSKSVWSLFFDFSEASLSEETTSSPLGNNITSHSQYSNPAFVEYARSSSSGGERNFSAVGDSCASDQNVVDSSGSTADVSAINQQQSGDNSIGDDDHRNHSFPEACTLVEKQDQLEASRLITSNVSNIILKTEFRNPQFNEASKPFKYLHIANDPLSIHIWREMWLRYHPLGVRFFAHHKF